MIGIALLTGLAAFIGVRLALRHGPWGGHRHCRWGHHHHRDLEHDHGPRRPGPRMILRAVLRRIGARPDQEDTIRAAVDELRATLDPLRGEGRRTRHELADALRKSAVDEVQLGEMFARHDNAIETARKAAVGALVKVHDALDDRQRHRLADLVASGPRPFRGLGW